MVKLQGPIVALLTPFDKKGEIDWRAFKTYLAALSSWGVRSVIANGTTGEFPSLTFHERRRTGEFVRENFEGTIIDNVSATSVADVRNLIAGTRGCADFLLLLPPYYYAACRDAGLGRFFIDALSGAPVPALLYHFPQHSGNRLGVELVAKLLEQGLPIAGIKDSSGDLNHALLYKTNFPEMAVFLGNDAKALEALQQGLTGSVTGGANPLPELLIALQTDIRSSGGKAESFQRCLDVWNAFREAGGHFEIPLVKAAMGARIPGFPIHVRPPFTPIPPDEVERTRTVIRQCMEEFKRLAAP